MSAKRVLWRFGAGVGGRLLVATPPTLLAGLIVDHACEESSDERFDKEQFVDAVACAFVGGGVILITAASMYAAGSSVGVYWAGKSDRMVGNLAWTLVGGTVGIGLAPLLTTVLGGNSETALWGMAAGAPVGATIANLLSRRSRSPKKTSALINVYGGRWHFGVPAFTLARVGPKETLVGGVHLIHVRL